ncbi:MAG: hypothetical protein R3E66_10085 [bacterium]
MTTRCAQGTFDTYLDGLHGWPPTTPVTLPVSAALDPATVNANTVKLFKITEEGLEEVAATVSYAAGETTVSIETSMGLDERYVAIATTSIATDAQDAGGRPLPLLPAPGIALAVQPFDVVNASGESLVSEVPDEDAQSIAAAQGLLKPLVAAIAQKTGVDYSRIAAIWTWETWTDSFVVFDPSTGRFPFPTAFATVGCPEDRPVCGVYDVENPPADPLQNAIFDEVSRRDGFSTTSTNWVPTEGRPLDPESVNSDNVIIAEAESTIPTPCFAR